MKRVEVLNKIRDDYEFVAEIGAGPAPYHGSNVIIDKYPFDNIERYANIHPIAPVIKADASSLPFLKKSVDLLFISQVIEHLPDPILFLKEAKRVARDIYMETPSIVREVIFGWSFHRWVIRVKDGKWIFYKNDLPQLCAAHFHNEKDVFFVEYTANNFDKFNNYYYGPVDKLEFEISTATALEYLAKTNHKKTNFPAATTDVAYADKISAVLYLLLKNLIPSDFKSALKNIRFALKRSRRNATTDLGAVAKGRLMCVFCKRPIEIPDGICACGITLKRVNGILSFDTDDYSKS